MNLEKELNELKEKCTPKETAKFILGTLANLGATAAVIALMRSPLHGSKGIVKLLMKLGIFILACKAGDMAEEHVEKMTDEFEEAIQDGSKTIKEAVANG